MTSKELLDATMQLDHKFLDEADARAAAVIPSGRNRIRLLPVMTAAAACLTAVIGLRMYLMHNNGMTEQNSTSDSLIAEMTGTVTTSTDVTVSGTETQTVTTHAKSSKKNGKTANTTAAPFSGTAKADTTQKQTAKNNTTNGNTTNEKTTKTEPAKSNTTAEMQFNPNKYELVPRFFGDSWTQAQSEAAYRHLKVTKKVVTADDLRSTGKYSISDLKWFAEYSTGSVVEQSIETDTEVAQGTVIELSFFESVSENELTLVPDFSGMTWSQAQANAMLNNLKVTKKVIQGNGAKGTVQSQSIAADTDVEPGTTVEVRVLAGEPEPVEAQIIFYHLFPATGKYHICLYEDGVLQHIGPIFYPEFIRAFTTINIKGSGRHTYDAVLVNEKTGSQAEFGHVFVDFDLLLFSRSDGNLLGAMRQLGGTDYEHDSFSDEIRVEFLKYGLSKEEQEYHQTYELDYAIPANARGTYKIVTYLDGFEVADSGWFDAGKPDTVITMKLEDNGPALNNLREYVSVLYCAETGEHDELESVMINQGKDEIWRRYTLSEAYSTFYNTKHQMTVFSGDFDLDGKITGADRLLSAMILKAEKQDVLDMVPLTAEQLDRAAIIPGEKYGAPDYNSAMPLSDQEDALIRDTWNLQREFADEILEWTDMEFSVDYFLFENFSYNLTFSPIDELWESYKDQIDFTKLGFAGTPTFNEFMKQTDQIYMEYDNWYLPEDELQERRKVCRKNTIVYSEMELRIRRKNFDNEAWFKTLDQIDAYIDSLAAQKKNRQSDSAPSWDTLLNMIEAFRNT